MSAKVVPVMRVAMMAVFVASAMVQVVELVVVATELVREACYGEEKEDSPPSLSSSASHRLLTAFLVHECPGTDGSGRGDGDFAHVGIGALGAT
jgi:hypothetical protein